jgi:hypothetical protein
MPEYLSDYPRIIFDTRKAQDGSNPNYSSQVQEHYITRVWSDALIACTPKHKDTTKKHN